MADSLNNFFEKAGEKLGEIYGNKKIKPDGTTKFSGLYTGPNGGGISRTEGSDAIGQSINPNPSPGQKSPAKSLTDESGKSYPAGFTPLSYFRTGAEIIILPVGNNILEMGDKFESNSSSFNNGVGVGGTSPGSKNGILGVDDRTHYDFKYSLDKYENWPNEAPPLKPIGKNDRESFDGSFSDKSWEKIGNQEFNRNAVNWAAGTPHENEDPVYFGFDIIIDSLNSPLLNGQSDQFLNNFSSSIEIESRTEILKSFQTELSKFFKFNSDKLEESNMFGSKIKKRHYIKKISGLEKLMESNGPKNSKSFTKYKEDTIKISFYEDSLLSTGSLASLYKLLYWSRINGKNIIPENLLRFDCEVIVSEVRNLARVRKSVSGNNLNLEVLKENVSRYVYKIYECQFHFQNMTHPSDVDLEANSPSQNWEIEMSFKFSDMRFERFVFEGDYGKYKTLWNSQSDPREVKPSQGDDAIQTSVGLSIVKNSSSPTKIENDITGLSGLESEVENTDGLESESEDILGDTKDNDKKAKRDKLKETIKNASTTFVDSIKTASLNEAQRQINNQFRLLNDSLDKVRNAFGVGRMSAPTNVYSIPNNGSRFFFDVQNSLRGFGGDVLGGLITGG